MAEAESSSLVDSTLKSQDVDVSFTEFLTNVIFWRRPVLSGLVLGIGVLLFWLVDQGWSFLSLVAYSLLVVLIMAGCYVRILAVYLKLSQRCDDPQHLTPQHDVVYVSPKIVNLIAKKLARAINRFLNSLFVNGTGRSLLLALALSVLGWLGQRVSDRVVVLSMFLLLMTVPPLCQRTISKWAWPKKKNKKNILSLFLVFSFSLSFPLRSYHTHTHTHTPWLSSFCAQTRLP